MVRFPSLIVMLAFLTGVGSPLVAAEKLKFGTDVRNFHPYYLPVLAAEEKGFWTQNGLDTQWVPFDRVGSFHQAIAAGSLNLGTTPATSVILGVSRGLPAVMVAEILPLMEFFIWVRTDSGIKKGGDLKGKRVGVSRLASVAHASAIVMTRGLGVEKDVKIVGTGGIVQVVAGLQSQVIDGSVVAMFSSIAKLKLAGKVQELVGMRDYLPKEWVDNVVIARKDFVASNPDMAKRAVKAFLEGMDFVKRNPAFSIEKIKSFEGLSDEVATMLYRYYEFSKDGKINPKAVENVRNFLLEHKLIPATDAPRVDDLYTRQFTG